MLQNILWPAIAGHLGDDESAIFMNDGGAPPLDAEARVWLDDHFRKGRKKIQSDAEFLRVNQSRCGWCQTKSPSCGFQMLFIRTQ